MTSFDPRAYAEAAAAALDLPLSDACKPGVVANLARLAAMANQLLDFPLPGPSNDTTSPMP